MFEWFALYSQKWNGVSEQKGRIIINMIRTTILRGNLDNKLWIEIILVITYTKNIGPTNVLNGDSLYHI